MAEETGAKTEQPTPKRKADARKKGQVAISRDVSIAATVLGGMLIVWLIGQPAIVTLTTMMQEWLRLATVQGLDDSVTPETLRAILFKAGGEGLLLVLPLILGVGALGVGATAVQTGLLWRPEGMRVDPSRISPLAGARRLVSLRAVVELIKSLLKIVVIALAAYIAIRQDLVVLPSLAQMEVPDILNITRFLVLKVWVWIGLTVACVALADYGYQRFEWQRGLKMTRHEVKQEHRETEGDPILRGRVRSVQREMARKRMMAAVPKADVVVTNPTHLAVALQYEHQRMAAPVVVAKGAGYVAERIKEIAREHGVMVVENKPVARSLYTLAEVGQMIPADLYRAVAEILALVYRARGTELGRG